MVNDSERERRLRADLQTLKRLQQSSSIFTFEACGDPPDRYTLRLRGTGIARRAFRGQGDVELIKLHEIDMRLPFGYPAQPPDLRWVTPILHPNISFSGFIQVRDLGIPWDETVTLDVVCERLWDAARMAYVNLDHTTNFSARNWLEAPHSVALPTDVRPLRDLALHGGRNVVSYQRRGAPAPQETAGEVFFIGDDTPVPPRSPRRAAPGRPQPRGDDDILYIGDE